MKLKTCITLSLTAILLTGVVNITYAYVVNKHWKKTGTINYQMSSLFSSSARNAFAAAANAWNNVPLGKIDLIESPNYTSTTAFGLNGINEIFLKNYGSASSTLMITHGYIANGIIQEFDISVNSNENWSTSGASSGYDIQSCATHEFGHTLCLSDIKQQSQVQSTYQNSWQDVTMYAYMAMGETKKRTLHQDDINGFVDAYKNY